MKKRSSVFTNVAISFAAFYTLYSLVYFVYRANDSYEAMIRVLAISTSNQLKTGRILLKANQELDLEDRLHLALDERQFHFYLLRKSGVDLAYGNAAGTEERIPILAGTEGTVETKEFTYSTIIEGPYQLTIGYKTIEGTVFSSFWQSQRDAIIKDIAIVFISVLLVVLYSFRDLRLILQRLTKRGAQRGDLELATSKETLTLVRGLKGFESQAQTLTQEREKFRTQVLGALRKELESGKTPPYEFECTLVRTDINNFTTIFSSDKRQHFMDVINEFFIGVTHIVSRYGGSIHEFVGDEVLFYFKDEEHGGNSTAVAIAALRDINKLALKISDQTESDQGYSLRIKSSLSHGTLRFGPLVDAYALAGPPLIESVRLLSHVHEKSENTVLFDESLTDATTELCRSKRQQVVMLKGLPGARTLVTLEAFTPLSFHLRQQDEAGLAMSRYYRDDDDICQILNFVRTNQGVIEAKTLNKVLSNFRAYTVAKSSKAVRREYVDCLSKLMYAAEMNEADTHLLASLISSANNILTPTEWTAEVRELLLESLNHDNKRVVANTLDVFSVFEPDAAETIFANLAQSGDNRIVANLLVKNAKKSWDRKAARKLKALLHGQSPFLKASGLYALGEIAKFLKATDEVAFSADSEIQSLLDQAKELESHANAMVVRQAKLARTKAFGAAPEVAISADSNVVPLRRAN